MAIQSHKGRRTMLTVAVAFILPVILAYAALQGNWFNKAVTNHGQLLNPTISLSSLTPNYQQFAGKWQLIAVLPSNCRNSCDEAVYSVQQVFTALGREQDRTHVLVVSDPSVEVNDAASSVPLVITDELPQQIAAEDQQAFVVIADPHGNIMLKFSNFASREQAIATSKHILLDVKKLLKLSRIG